jgi:hypothetical protein
MRLPTAALVAALALACQGTKSSVSEAYRADLENLCDAEARSGALDQPESARAFTVAQWLGPALKTAEARSFLAGLAAAGPSQKGLLLREEAAKAGLKSCPLADTWH